MLKMKENELAEIPNIQEEFVEMSYPPIKIVP